MLFLWVLIWLYCVVIPWAWCWFWYRLRPTRSRIQSWALASVLAVGWLPFWVQFRMWARRNPPTDWIEALEAELQAIVWRGRP